ncbi:MAG: hypothetical protein DRO11_06020 [Methanobacteriota archaeon]|nr:MAG: hypothetical protein DRO11_06020 [Euryarchaeota archaeon]
MKKCLILAVLGTMLSLISILIGLKLTEAATVGEVYKVTFMSVYPPAHEQYVLTCQYLDMVEAATKGRIKFERYPSHQLVPPRQALDATGKGMIHILNSYSPYYSGKVATGCMGFPGAWPNPASWAYNFFNDAELRNLVSKQYLDKSNVLLPLMHAFVPGSCFIMAPGKEIRKLEDFRGKKIRGPGGAIPAIFKRLNAATVTLIGSEWYTAMQRGTVDGVMGYPYTLRTYRLLEVAGSVTKYRMVPTICPMLFVNADFWNSLPQGLKDTMIKVNEEWTWEVMMPAVAKQELADWKLAKDKGLQVIELPKEDVDKLNRIASAIGREWYLSTCKDQGYGEVARKIVDKMEKATNEWPTLEKKLLKEGKIRKGGYMYPAE